MSAMRSVYYIEELERENKIQLKIDGERDTKKPKQTGKNSNIWTVQIELCIFAQ